jgi:hypothetical protein
MICPECQRFNQRSIIRITRTTPGSLAKDHYFDEDGVEHTHNPNVVVTEYSCSNGHRFAERSSWQCWCGYKACEQEIVVPTELAPAAVAVPTGPPVRTSSGKVITSAERARLNERNRR